MKYYLSLLFTLSMMAFTLLLGTILPAHAYRQSDFDDCKHVNGNNYYQACIRLLEMASLPDHVLAIAQYGVGSHYYWRRQYRKALPYFRKTIELNPAHKWAYLRQGRSLAALGQFKKAIKVYSEGINYNAMNRAKTYFNRGYAYSMTGHYEQAIEDLSRYIFTAQDDALAYHHRGYALFKIGRYQEAIEDLSKSLTLKPNNAQTHDHRGDSYYYLKDYPKAIRDYSAAMMLKPQKAAYPYKRGTSFRQTRAFNKSIADCKTAKNLDPYFIPAYYCLALGYIRRLF